METMILTPGNLPRVRKNQTPWQAAWRAPRSTYLILRRYLDAVIALVLLILLSPVILCAAILVRCTSRGPAFYSQVRVGLDGRLFLMHKLRTMTHNCERSSGVRWTAPWDSRVTPVGKLLRASKIDELPQLWNVIRGEMALIGPRPERPEFVANLTRVFPSYPNRHCVRPGLSGLAQINLPADSGLESVRRKLAYDLYYINNFGLWMDLKVWLGTLLYVLGLLRSQRRGPF
jgi:lipopolysaccharide/colanic/teichoic acid biosynthesis glycosyltransferase